MKITQVSILFNFKAPRPKRLQRGAGHNQYEVSTEVGIITDSLEKAKSTAMATFRVAKEKELAEITADPSR